MLPRRLARSMTKNFLMRSLWDMETVCESTVLHHVSKQKLSEDPPEHCINHKCTPTPGSPRLTELCLYDNLCTQKKNHLHLSKEGKQDDLHGS